jgi:hypothetical protein
MGSPIDAAAEKAIEKEMVVLKRDQGKDWRWAFVDTIVWW